VVAVFLILQEIFPSPAPWDVLVQAHAS